VLDDDSTWLVDLAAPDRVEQTESVGTTAREADARDPEPVYLSMAQDTGALVIPNNGGVQVVDPVGRYTWTLAAQPPAANLYDTRRVAYTDPRISTDGTRVIARLPDALVTWSITVPAGAAETARWVDSLTNAAIDPGRAGKLIWR